MAMKTKDSGICIERHDSQTSPIYDAPLGDLHSIQRLGSSNNLSGHFEPSFVVVG